MQNICQNYPSEQLAGKTRSTTGNFKFTKNQNGKLLSVIIV